MRVDDLELFNLIEAGLQEFQPLPDHSDLFSQEAVALVRLVGFQHGQLIGWKEVLEVVCLPGYGSEWNVVPLRGGIVALALRASLSSKHQQLARAWQERAHPGLTVAGDADGCGGVVSEGVAADLDAAGEVDVGEGNLAVLAAALGVEGEMRAGQHRAQPQQPLAALAIRPCALYST